MCGVEVPWRPEEKSTVLVEECRGRVEHDSLKLGEMVDRGTRRFTNYWTAEFGHPEGPTQPSPPLGFDISLGKREGISYIDPRPSAKFAADRLRIAWGIIVE